MDQCAAIFPVGFLQLPFFGPTRDRAVNFGAAGAVIGYEVTHAFDDIGRKLDDRGNWRDWWTPVDEAAFEERTACVVDQYSRYEIGGGGNLNGRLTPEREHCRQRRRSFGVAGLSRRPGC